jgi:CheY-like chemotaxis protein
MSFSSKGRLEPSAGVSPLRGIFENEPQESAGIGVFLTKTANRRARKGTAVSSPSPDRPLRILIVDDDPVFRELIAFVLRADVGAEIVGQAFDGAEGVELAQELHPDVVVMDLRMPGMDGFEATRQIAATVPDARVIVVSSSKERGDIERAGRAGAAGYVPKDRAVAELSDAVGQLRPAKAEGKRGSLSLFFSRRLVLG